MSPIVRAALGAALFTLAACSSSGGAGPALAGSATPDGCSSALTCGAGTYKYCSQTSTTSCAAQYVTSDGKSYACTNCNDCQLAAASVTAWCTGQPIPGSTGNHTSFDGGTDPGPVATPMPGTSSGDGACQAQATQACVSCCQTAHPAGFQTYSSLLSACACSGTCSTDCADNLCTTGSSPSTACNSCIQSSCTSTTSSCTADTDCKAFIGCAAGCRP